MFDIDRWREIFEAINKNKLRTILSGFTIAFAILIFTLLFGIGNGLKHTFEREFAGDSMLSIYLWPGRTTKPYKGLQSGRRIQFRNDDYKFIMDEYESSINSMSPRIIRQSQVTYQNNQNSYQVRAVYPSYQGLESLEMRDGRFINMLDLDRRSKVAIIGRLVEIDLFGQLSGMGKNINVNGISFKVIGVFTDPGGDNDERYIYTPFSTIQHLYGNTDHVDAFGLLYNPKMSVDEAITFGNRLERKMKERHMVSPNDNRGIRVNNYAEGNRNVSQFMMVLNFIILFIGIGTLIAGVIGISNIMVYIVKERTKELGVRKALGATPRSIITMIMMESVLITAIAGYVGLLIGTTILESIGNGLESYFIINPSVETYVVVGATIVLIIAGMIAGYIPAKRAARIKPIVALRDE
ncbi:ABC transporter permease [Urechidicola vernalis]|uniref:ABC transporter permease n=1 Tax=Urechidicola vernalis TaxID=3075600 RepID=A0ABU2Y0P3_9FLAO|nr:ABC transporter permease [Urechidicola sp. P050]MDT0551739.1 ABC transporter permease [Urechidicola sp. P050]